MAGLRKGRSYRKVKRAYTRKSKFKAKSFIKAIPSCKIARFKMGDLFKKFNYEIELSPKETLQIRHNALESVRQVVNRHLEINLGSQYLFQIRVFPHHILREHKMLTGAGADRMSPGMSNAFGKPVGIAAQLKRGQTILSIAVNKEHLEIAKKAMSLAKPRLPGSYLINVKELKLK